MTTYLDKRLGLIEAITLELQTLTTGDLQEILTNCQARNNEHEALRQELRAALPPVIKPRKTGVFREVRTVLNRGATGSETYQWAFDVTYEEGKRVKVKSIGRVE